MRKTHVCDTCGAVVTGDRCDLCGSPVKQNGEHVGTVTDHAVASQESDPHSAGVETRHATGLVKKLVCPTCGAANRADAKFCDQCGESFSAETIPSAIKKPPVPKSQQAKAKKPADDHLEAQPRIGLYVLGAIAAVVTLYIISIWTGDSSPPPESAPAVQTSPSSGGDLDTYLPEDADLTASLTEKRAAVDAATDAAERQALREEIVQSYAAAGRLDLAGREQERLAAEISMAEAWAAAGNMHFDWMEAQSGPERVKAAQRAARAYEESLAIDDSNLDVRTDLGVAYLNDPSSPMLAIQNTNMVLATDSNHVQANFNKGVMLAQIGRRDEAIRLFRKVTRLSPPGEPAHDRAQQVLDQLGAGAAPTE